MVVPSYSECTQRLKDMKPRYDTGFTPSDREFLGWLNVYLFGKPIVKTQCQDCHRDAYLMITLKLKKDGKMPDNRNYKLAPGVLLHEFGSSEYHTLYVSDEVAETHLHKQPEDAKLFELIPSDWEERVSKRFAPKTEQTEAKPSEPKRGKKMKEQDLPFK